MKLEDIVLKKGDRVYFKDGDVMCVKISGDNADDYNNIAKIERPEIIYEEPKQILDKEEKEYLEAVIRPFKDRVNSVAKKYAIFTKCEEEEIIIDYDNGYGSFLPHFTKGTMYKGMELWKEYTLEELGLFEEV